MEDSKLMFSFMERFNLDEKPYINLENVWCRDGHSIYFIEEGCVYSAVQGDVIGEEDGITCINNDVQQFT